MFATAACQHMEAAWSSQQHWHVQVLNAVMRCSKSLSILMSCCMIAQDVIARAGRFWGLYKRAGQRVMINPSGDLIVRPTFIEAAAQLMRPWGTISHNLHLYPCLCIWSCSAQYLRCMISALHLKIAIHSPPVREDGVLHCTSCIPGMHFHRGLLC